ncbi:MAG TPA: tetratricopeptide repeat protein, partial [bacterium]|nr:tetratricopeptide repeat protein [bacterium]
MTPKAPSAFRWLLGFAGVFFSWAGSQPAFSAPGVEQPDALDQGRILLRARAYELALNRFLQVERDSGNPGERALALRMIGETQFQNADYGSAYQAYQQSLRLAPLSSSRSTLEFKAAVSLVYLKKYDEALRQFGLLESRIKDRSFLTDLYFWEGECYFQTGRYDQARLEYGKIFATNMRYPYVYLVRYLDSWCAFEQKDYDEALRGFGEVGAKTDNPILKKLSLFQTAESLFRSGRYAEAEKTYENFLGQYPGDPLRAAALYGLGWTQEKQEKLPQALQSFGEVVDQYPGDPLAPWAAVRQGVEASGKGDRAGAEKDYQKALSLSPDRSPADLAEFGLGWLDFSAGRYDPAASHFQSVGRLVPDSQLRWDAEYLRAGAAYLQGDYPGAEKIYEGCAAGAPADLAQASRFWSAWCDYHIGRFQDALDSFRKLSGADNGLWKPRALWGAGECAYQLVRYGDALSFYQEALSSDDCPVSLECFSGIGWSYFQQEKYSQAFEAFQKAVTVSPHSALAFEAQLRSGDCQYNLHQFDQAQVQYQKVLQTHAGPPYEWDALEQLGWCAYRSEDFTQAVQQWSRLATLAGAEDRKPRLFYWMAWAYFRDKQYQKAADQFKAVESAFPGDALAPESHLREGDCYFNLKDFHQSQQ